jgi:uncharacterized protein
MIRFEFDPAKNEANLAKHGVDMAAVAEFEFDTALIAIDTRKSYSETRYIAVGYITGRLHVLVFAKRGSTLRVISLRKANRGRWRRMSTKRKKPIRIPAKDWNDVDSPALTDRVFKRLAPLREVFPDLAEYASKRRRGQRGPQKAPKKQPVTIRLDQDILASYKATGPGWQSRMNDALRRAARSL